jgi:peptidoglycan/xylan/chitin deacetylase (PgdA/CDA1 family)
MFEGGEHVLNALKKNRIKASFFFTGNFLRLPEFENITKKIIADGHYVGAHSDRHLLYCDWTKRDSLLIDYIEFIKDLRENYRELSRFGIQHEDAGFYMPPFEWYNKKIVDWCAQIGIDVVNFTPGTGTNADYTTPEMKNYRSSGVLYRKLMEFEEKENLNGAIILIHPGTSVLRMDKFYLKLNELINELKQKGYDFIRFQ